MEFAPLQGRPYAVASTVFHVDWGAEVCMKVRVSNTRGFR